VKSAGSKSARDAAGGCAASAGASTSLAAGTGAPVSLASAVGCSLAAAPFALATARPQQRQHTRPTAWLCANTMLAVLAIKQRQSQPGAQVE
jgi:hypothetical protein